ncbi:unnamed protein product [Paramecium sonneborni]|uniref:Uncharacterized protein n=1 Tax=Paramecium sonneborni TaxID=65129 RepID=A0A8S1LXD3_9CILI|nr:unnamed protein product [Paramecium sonneborni]
MKVLYFVLYYQKNSITSIFYLSNFQDRSFEDNLKIISFCYKLYSPQKQLQDQTNLNQINQEIFQEARYLIKIMENQYQQYIVPIQSVNSNDQKEFYDKYFDDSSNKKENQDQINNYHLENKFQKKY